MVIACGKKSDSSAQDKDSKAATLERANLEAAAALKRIDELAAKPTPAVTGKIDGKLDTKTTIIVPADQAARAAYFAQSSGDWPWFTSEMEMQDLRKYLSGTPYPGNLGPGYVAWIKGKTYLAVVRTTELTLPVAKIGAFSPGTVTGEVHAYEIASGKYLGGAWFTAASSDKVTFVDHEDSPQQKVLGDFRDKAAAAIRRTWTEGGLPPAAASTARIAYELPAGWEARDVGKANVLVAASKGTDPATMQTVLLTRMERPVPFDTTATCEAVAKTFAKSLGGKLASEVHTEKGNDEVRGSCEFEIDFAGHTVVILVIDASEGAPFVFQCDGPSPNSDNKDCQAIWKSIDLP